MPDSKLFAGDNPKGHWKCAGVSSARLCVKFSCCRVGNPPVITQLFAAAASDICYAVTLNNLSITGTVYAFSFTFVSATY
jgi:hypothetical protein